MATLVLQSVGSSLGGPVGSAIGAMVGQQVDQRLFGPGPRRGPRLGDLSIQGSSYGARVPAIYGRMRVAGTIVWATDLEESEAVTGAKGQPETVTYGYRANFAVALSSRVQGQLGRIWADGKLLRGAAGDIKVPGAVRLLAGGEAQAVDPLIASVENDCPAYRDFLLLVFEGLELAEYGNRIPLITVEVIADEAAVSLSALVGEASGGAIEIDEPRQLEGYAAHGGTIGDALSPLLEAINRPLKVEGGRLVAGSGAMEHDLKAEWLDAGPEGTIERRTEALLPDARMPRRIGIDYYDASRDYQAGRAEARAAGGRRDETIDLPAVLGAGEARALCEEVVRQRWRQRRTVEARLSLACAGLRPGDLVRLGGDGALWELTSVEFERFAVRIEARWTGHGVATPVASDAGRAVTAPDVERSASRLALIEPPDLDGSGRCRLMVAAANASAGWRAVPIELVSGDIVQTIQSAGRESSWGTVEGVLGGGSARLLDTRSEIVVTLVDPQIVLQSVSMAALLGGANTAMVGDELVQYRIAEPLGEGRYRLREFLRGRRGSESAIQAHGPGEAFVSLDLSRLATIDWPVEKFGIEVVAQAAGLTDEDSDPVAHRVSGRAARPLSPVHLSAALDEQGVAIAWTRRSRSGFAWVDGVDAPLGERLERYRWAIEGNAGRIEGDCADSEVSVAGASLGSIGDRPWTVSVWQVGDHGVSEAAIIMVEE